MKAVSITILLYILWSVGLAQNIGVNGTGAVPDVSAGLDVSFANKGLLIPRIALTGVNDAVTITTPATSLLVYNTNVALPGGAGYYYNSGTAGAPVWVRLTTGAASNDWTLLGNAGTNPATNFVGTTDAQDWVVRTNNTERMRVLSGGDVGIGTATPTSKLHVVWDNTEPEIGIVAAAVSGQAVMVPAQFVAGDDRASFGYNFYANPNTQLKYRGGINVASGMGFGGDINLWTAPSGTFNTNLTPNVRMTIKNNGDVGIGTIAPGAKLEVQGDVKIVDGTEGAGKVLTSDATGLASWQTPAAGGGGGGFTNMQVFTAGGNFTVPAGVTNVMVEVIGGGGGGASGSSAGTRGCGGMGGGYGKSYLTVVPSAVHAVVVGAGGLGAPSGPCSLGSTGGTSSFGTPILIQSTGGQGGNGCGSNSTRNGGTSTGQLSMTGARGPDGQTNGRHYGGLSGNGSTYGQGGIGDSQFFGRDGTAGIVIVHW